MRRFQFRLERFLELRRWKEREWELKLARALGECLVAGLLHAPVQVKRLMGEHQRAERLFPRGLV